MLPPDTRVGFQEFSRRAGDFALSMAVVTYRLESGKIADARVGIGGAEPYPRRIAEAEAALNGKPPGPEAFQPPAKPPPRRSSRLRISTPAPNIGAISCAR